MAAITTTTHYFLVIVGVIVLIILVIAMFVSAFGTGITGSPYVKENSPVLAQSRKMLAELKLGLHKANSLEHGKTMVGSELRAAPSGPDPMHHNGGSPRQPRISP